MRKQLSKLITLTHSYTHMNPSSGGCVAALKMMIAFGAHHHRISIDYNDFSDFALQLEILAENVQSSLCLFRYFLSLSLSQCCVRNHYRSFRSRSGHIHHTGDAPAKRKPKITISTTNERETEMCGEGKTKIIITTFYGYPIAL